MKQINSLKHAAAGLTSLAALLVLTLALALPLLVSSCQAEDDPAGGPDGFTVEITTLSGVAIEPMDGAATAQQQNYPNSPSKLEGVPPCGAGACVSRTTTARTATTASEAPLTGYTASVKTRFVPGDVLHIYLAADAAHPDIEQFSTATLTDPGTGAAPVWHLDPPLRLPANAQDTYFIRILYDGRADRYTDSNTFNAAENRVLTATVDPDNGSTGTYFDMLGGFYRNLGGGQITSIGITPTADGRLVLNLIHQHTLVSIPVLDNELGADVQSVTAILVDKDGNPTLGHTATGTDPADTPVTGGIPMLPDPDATSTSPGAPVPALPLTALCAPLDIRSHLYLHAFRVQLTDGRTLTLPVPPTNASGNPDSRFPGRYLASAHRYLYRLTLLPGSATATALTDGSDTQPWDNRADPAVPAGYIPIYTADDLRKIGTNSEATFGTYTYTDDATGQPLTFSFDAKYILMADIDLTPANPANPTDKELWTPIGVDPDKLAANPDAGPNLFFGHLNGNGHVISGLTIKTAAPYAGLFAATSGAVIYNLHLQDARVKSTYSGSDFAYAGALIGYSGQTTLALCSATHCTVTVPNAARGSAGGLVGKVLTVTLTRCYAIGCNTQAQEYAGGLGGYNANSSIVACYTSGCAAQSNDNDQSGGLAGDIDASIVYGCYAAKANADGALTGVDIFSPIVSSYATNGATTNGKPLVGIGRAAANSSKVCYASISPLKNGNGNRDVNYACYWGTATGYSHLTDATDLDYFATIINDGTFVGKTSYNFSGRFRDTDAALLSVPTARANPDGSLHVEPRNWTAVGIWGNDLPTTETEGNQVAPHIVWSYEGDSE